MSRNCHRIPWKDHYRIIPDKESKPPGIYVTADKDGVIVIE